MVSDEALYEQLLRGDLGAFDALYERHARHLFGFILRQVADRAEAEDLLHEAFMAVLRERDAGRSPRSLRAWLYQVARNLCLNRSRLRQRAARALAAVAHTPQAPVEHPERVLEQRQDDDALRQAVARLPNPLAELFHLRAGGLSYQELAEILGVPVGTIKSRIHEMVGRLREEVQR